MVMADEPFTTPGHRPAPRQPQPGEPLFEFYLERDHARRLCELRDHGACGIEAWFWQHEDFLYSRRFDRRTLAVRWAEEERNYIEKGGA